LIQAGAVRIIPRLTGVQEAMSATFQRIDESDETSPGPRAVLVCGFATDILAALRGVLERCGAPDHRVVFCSRDMVKQTLKQALEATEPAPPAAPDTLPRAMVLSGMTGTQLQAFLSEFKASKLPRPIFASVTPINLGFQVGKLLVELLAEQREMSKRR
jgi:hypothetical protein